VGWKVTHFLRSAGAGSSRINKNAFSPTIQFSVVYVSLPPNFIDLLRLGMTMPVSILKASEYKLQKELGAGGTTTNKVDNHKRVVFKNGLSLPSAKVGVGESSLRLFLEAEISAEVTAIRRAFSRSGKDPGLIDLLCDDVVSFSSRFELDLQDEIAISGVSVIPLAAALPEHHPYNQPKHPKHLATEFAAQDVGLGGVGKATIGIPT
jgi:hypothetical protein